MIEQEVLKLLRETNDEIPDDAQVNLLAAGLIDSFDIVNIVAALEEHFGIEISAEEIVPENFGSVENMAALVEKCKKQ